MAIKWTARGRALWMLASGEPPSYDRQAAVVLEVPLRGIDMHGPQEVRLHLPHITTDIQA